MTPPRDPYEAFCNGGDGSYSDNQPLVKGGVYADRQNLVL